MEINFKEPVFAIQTANWWRQWRSIFYTDDRNLAVEVAYSKVLRDSRVVSAQVVDRRTGEIVERVGG